MRLDTPFVRLPVRVDPHRLAAEVAQLADDEWQVGEGGSQVVPLAAPDSRPVLERLPYVRQVLAALKSVIGNARLVRTSGDGSPRQETNAYSLQHARVLVPVTADADVRLVSGTVERLLKPSELWLRDTWSPQSVLGSRLELLIDTVGSADFWDMAADGERPFADPPLPAARPDHLIRFDPAADPPFQTAQPPAAVMSPWEIECLFAELAADVTDPASDTVTRLQERQWTFLRDWRNLWAAFGSHADGQLAFRNLLDTFTASLGAFRHNVPLVNGLDAVAAIQGVLELAAPTFEPANTAPPATGTSMPMSSTPPARRDPAAEPLRSVFTGGLVELFEQLGISLLVSTYQAGKLVIVRVQDGKLNTHFRNLHAPMGLAVADGRLAIGTKNHVWEFHNQPAVAKKVEPAGTHDACFIPRVVHTTGDIRVHEIGWAGDDLWVVNTRFSCLCTLDREYSFVPRWRPKFVTALSPEDRCHLNGLCITGDPPRPKYVTCLGATDTAGGWRANKRDGGLLLDVSTQEVVARGLSMPHSPRVYDSKLWLLESGVGGLGYLDPSTGKVESVATLPGFTRGIDFVGPFAFVGLSQVRETAAFSGLPVTELPVEERACGVWVVDLRNGSTVGFIRFEEGVQEIFAVHALIGVRSPELFTTEDEWLANSFVLPDEALREVPSDLRKQ